MSHLNFIDFNLAGRHRLINDMEHCMISEWVYFSDQYLQSGLKRVNISCPVRPCGIFNRFLVQAYDIVIADRQI